MPDQEAITLFKQFLEYDKVTMELPVAFPDGYYVKVTKVNDDGSFEGQLLDVAPCL